MKAAIYLSCNLFHVSLERRMFYFCTNTRSQVLENLLVDYNVFFIIFFFFFFRFDVFVKASISTYGIISLVFSVKINRSSKCTFNQMFAGAVIIFITITRAAGLHFRFRILVFLQIGAELELR